MTISALLRLTAIVSALLAYSAAVLAFAYAASGRGRGEKFKRAVMAAAAGLLCGWLLWMACIPFLGLWIDFDFLLHNGYIWDSSAGVLARFEIWSRVYLAPPLILLVAALPPALLLRAAQERGWLSRRLIHWGGAGILTLLAAADLSLAAAGLRMSPRPSWDVARLVEKLRDTDPFIRKKSLDVLRAKGPEAAAAAPAFRELLLNDPQLRWTANKALAKLLPESLPIFTDALRHENFQVRRAAAVELAQMGRSAEAALPELLIAARDPDSGVRWNVYKTLAGIGPAARPAIAILVEDLGKAGVPNAVRDAAAKALIAIGPECLPALMPLLRGEGGASLSGRYAAAGVLDGFGPAARPALPLLRKIQTDKKDEFRDHAARTARRIEAVLEPRQETVAPGRPKN